jgi:hypothetical protein
VTPIALAMEIAMDVGTPHFRTAHFRLLRKHAYSRDGCLEHRTGRETQGEARAFPAR